MNPPLLLTDSVVLSCLGVMITTYPLVYEMEDWNVTGIVGFKTDSGLDLGV